MTTGSRFKAPALFVALAMVVGMLVGLATPASATIRCRITNLDTGVSYGGTGSNLQTAIDEANDGARLQVRGVCVGNFEASKNLSLAGVATSTWPVPTLDGDNAGTVLTVASGRVHVRDLTITNGVGEYGGGIRNSGTLILTGTSRVMGNRAALGGGIRNTGRVALIGRASVVRNTAIFGGGIYNYNEGGSYAVVTMRGASSLRRNLATDGGGIYQDRDRSLGGGAAFNMKGSAVVSENTVTRNGGGIFNYYGTLNGAVGGDNVFSNVPDDIYIF